MTESNSTVSVKAEEIIGVSNNIYNTFFLKLTRKHFNKKVTGNNNIINIIEKCIHKANDKKAKDLNLFRAKKNKKNEYIKNILATEKRIPYESE